MSEREILKTWRKGVELLKYTDVLSHPASDAAFSTNPDTPCNIITGSLCVVVCVVKLSIRWIHVWNLCYDCPSAIAASLDDSDKVFQFIIITKRKKGEPCAYFLRHMVLQTSCINCLQAFGLLLGARTYKKSESKPNSYSYTQYLHDMVWMAVRHKLYIPNCCTLGANSFSFCLW